MPRLTLPDKKRWRVKKLLPAQFAINNQIVPIASAPLRLAQHALTGKTSLLQRPELGPIGDIRRGFNAHNGIDREKILGQQLLGLDAIALPAMLRCQDNAEIVGNARVAWTITQLP